MSVQSVERARSCKERLPVSPHLLAFDAAAPLPGRATVERSATVGACSPMARVASVVGGGRGSPPVLMSGAFSSPAATSSGGGGPATTGGGSLTQLQLLEKAPACASQSYLGVAGAHCAAQ